ncbi:MAG: hypothetical protein O7A03_10390 [Alphaproteobacteria bacterium]|nr:hypothetical protein [Alphaproteobacteria bacterium]
MHHFRAIGKRAWIALMAGALGLATAGCDSLEGNIALGLVGAVVSGGQSPSSEIRQIYYLGVFDPQDQLPPQVYRVRVNGQSSLISFVNFASGWVPADLIDSLGTKISFNKASGGIDIEKSGEGETASLKAGRRLVMFGREGFREAPAGHRLVVVMGSSPEGFFKAIDSALGTVAKALEDQRATGLNREVLQALLRISNERGRLTELDKDIAIELPRERLVAR